MKVMDVSNELSSLTEDQLNQVSTAVDAIKSQTSEKLVASQDGKNGQILRQYVTLDSGGTKISGRRIDWSYYPTGEVDIIMISNLDANDKVITVKKIKHYVDGRQPQELK